MCVLTSDTGLESGLSLDEIESRLVEAAHRHHLEERNMAYWLLEADRRSLHTKRGFSSIGDYAMELIGVKPQKAQYLVFIADRLEKLPVIAAAFNAGELPWTKAREIVRVATLETEQEWLEKAKKLSNRDLEKAVRKHEGTGSGEFVTLTISMPVELLSVWHDTYELAERVSGGELEKWQVLEPALAEFMSTYLAAAEENQRALFETEDEKGLSYEVRDAVFTRDGYQCVFPGCSARKTLDPHHILYKSRGGSDDPSNIVSLCRIHHALIHKGTCSVTGRVGVDLKFERPQLVTKKPAPEVEQAPIAEPLELPEEDDGSEDWRDETVAAIFDGPPSPPPAERTRDYGNVIDAWGAQQLAFERERRSRRRRASEHVFAEASVDDATAGSPDRASPDG